MWDTTQRLFRFIFDKLPHNVHILFLMIAYQVKELSVSLFNQLNSPIGQLRAFRRCSNNVRTGVGLMATAKD